jgi:hypothetical protein
LTEVIHPGELFMDLLAIINHDCLLATDILGPTFLDPLNILLETCWNKPAPSGSFSANTTIQHDAALGLRKSGTRQASVEVLSCK